MPPLPEPRAVHQIIGKLSDLLVEAEQEYRWAYPGFYNPDRRETEKVKGGHASFPTESVGLPNLGSMSPGERNEYARRRTEAESGLRMLNEAQEALKVAIRCFQDSQGRYTAVVDYDRENKGAAVGPRYVKKQREYQRKRQDAGGGFGET